VEDKVIDIFGGAFPCEMIQLLCSSACFFACTLIARCYPNPESEEDPIESLLVRTGEELSLSLLKIYLNIGI
jgi:hypothetical protein